MSSTSVCLLLMLLQTCPTLTLLWSAKRVPAGFLLLSACGPLTNSHDNPQVRVIVERLARRCGYDAVAAAMPEGDRKLLLHIQKEQLRKKRTQSRAGAEVRLQHVLLRKVIGNNSIAELAACHVICL